MHERRNGTFVLLATDPSNYCLAFGQDRVVPKGAYQLLENSEEADVRTNPHSAISRLIALAPKGLHETGNH